MSNVPPQYAFVTLVTSDNYLPGALVVAAALRELHPSPPSHIEEIDPHDFHIICLATPETVSVLTLKLLRKAFDVVIGVEVIEEDTEENLNLLGRPDLKTVLTKLHVFRLKSYRKIVYLDADVLPLLPLSHLFHNTRSFAAVPDVGWPDIFNSGVLVFTPGEDDFATLMRIIRTEGSWDGGDQGVLNEWRRNDWERLSFIYNTAPTSAYTYAPAYKRFGSQIKVIHFIGPEKPWSLAPFRAPGPVDSSATSSSSVDAIQSDYSYAYPCLLDRWFAIFDKYYRSTTPLFTTTGSPILTATFSEGTYTNAWNIGFKATHAGRAPLKLDELRRLALEGLGQSFSIEPGEGVYMTLPLQGRLDLMPLRRSYFREVLSLPLMFSPGSADSADMLDDETHNLAESTSRILLSGETYHDEPCNSSSSSGTHQYQNLAPDESQWDPWTRPYPNAWDLCPEIALKYANLSMFSKRLSEPQMQLSGTQENAKAAHRGWESKVESTSTDGDDEAEDGDG